MQITFGAVPSNGRGRKRDRDRGATGIKGGISARQIRVATRGAES